MKNLFPTCKAGICTICIVYRNKQLGFYEARTFTSLRKQKAIILQLFDSECLNNFSMPKVTLIVETAPHSTRLESGTSKLVFRFFLTA
jgi:hypothetical protein